MLGIRGFTYKKDLKKIIGKPLSPYIVETSIFGNEYKENGSNLVVGPDVYRSRKWYAKITCRDGMVIKVE
jgi:hypothetical protein